jgi:hypothetical protein
MAMEEGVEENNSTSITVSISTPDTTGEEGQTSDTSGMTLPPIEEGKLGEEQTSSTTVTPVPPSEEVKQDQPAPAWGLRDGLYWLLGYGSSTPAPAPAPSETEKPAEGAPVSVSVVSTEQEQVTEETPASGHSNEVAQLETKQGENTDTNQDIPDSLSALVAAAALRDAAPTPGSEKNEEILSPSTLQTVAPEEAPASTAWTYWLPSLWSTPEPKEVPLSTESTSAPKTTSGKTGDVNILTESVRLTGEEPYLEIIRKAAIIQQRAAEQLKAQGQ